MAGIQILNNLAYSNLKLKLYKEQYLLKLHKYGRFISIHSDNFKQSQNIMNLTRFDLIVFVSFFFVALYIYGKRKYKHFRNTGMKYVEPKIPFFGSTIKVLMQREHFSEFLMHYYNLFPNEKYIGLFEVQRPLILIRDLELLRKIGIKDFNHFMNHRSVISEELDPLFGKNLFSLQGEKWKDMRSTLSPAFTSSKMKNMFILIDECAKDVAEFYASEINNSKNGTVVIEAKDTFTRYTNDVIANSAFGLKVNSLKIKDNQFYRLAKIATNFSGVQIIKFAAYALFPKLMKMLDVQFIDPEAKSFFREIVKGTILYREENKIERHDMIHLLMEAQKGSLKHENDSATLSEAGYAAVQESMIGKQVVKRKWSDDEIVAQALIFLIGGFETTATLISFLFYELVRNSEIQKRLQQEIDDFNFKTGGILSYENLQSLKYLDMCVSETLRMWPPAIAIDRVCTNGYNLPPANDAYKSTYKVNADESIWIPVYAIHNDPKYFPNPSQFDPERFSEENRSALEQNAYMPFGVGPRNCIGSRFALMVVKTLTFHIVSKFDIEITDKTQIPVELAKNTLNLVSKNGIYIGLKPRINVEK